MLRNSTLPISSKMITLIGSVSIPALLLTDEPVAHRKIGKEGRNVMQDIQGPLPPK